MRREWIMRSPEGDGGGATPPKPSQFPQPPVPRRAGSMTLRDSTTVEAEGGLDPANQSLADALKVMMRLLQAGMVILAVLYVLSGLQSVREGERAIRLLFGKKVDENLEPGFRWSAPYPMGELVKVSRGYRELDLNKDFWIYVPDGAVDPSPDKQAPTQSLKPDQGGSGSVITADGNIAHTKWKVGYERLDTAKFAQNMLPEDEEKMVRAAVKRGVVEAVAQVTLDELLQQKSVHGRTITEMAQKVAQETLDRVESGLHVTLTMDPPIPPLAVRPAFNKASAASSNANKVIQEAQTYRNQQLNKAAGPVARYVVYYIDQYEHQLAKGDKPAADATLATIASLLDGSSVEVLKLDDDGKPEVEEKNQPTGRKVTIANVTTGDVASVMNEAKLYKTGVVSRAKSDASRYEAKLDQFKANPAVMVQHEWSEALRSFMSKGTVQTLLLPPGVNTLAVILNYDPQDAKDVDVLLKEAEAQRAAQRRLEDQRKAQETTTTATPMSE
jgi:regulator of protease activity HflC (stomatin/prohibitin superfamily)